MQIVVFFLKIKQNIMLCQIANRVKSNEVHKARDEAIRHKYISLCRNPKHMQQHCIHNSGICRSYQLGEGRQVRPLSFILVLFPLPTLSLLPLLALLLFPHYVLVGLPLMIADGKYPSQNCPGKYILTGRKSMTKISLLKSWFGPIVGLCGKR